MLVSTMTKTFRLIFRANCVLGFSLRRSAESGCLRAVFAMASPLASEGVCCQQDSRILADAVVHWLRQVLQIDATFWRSIREEVPDDHRQCARVRISTGIARSDSERRTIPNAPS